MKAFLTIAAITIMSVSLSGCSLVDELMKFVTV